VLPLAAQKNDKNQSKRSKAEQQDIETVVRLVDAVSAGQAAPSDYSLTWESNHFVKGQGGITYLPFTIDVDKALASKQVALYVRVVDKNAPAPAPPAPAEGKDKDKKAAPPVRIPYPWDNIAFTQLPGVEDGAVKLSRAIALKAGEYTAYITIKEKSTAEIKDPSKAPPPKVAFLKRDLSVPDFNAPGLSTSSVIVASSIEVMSSQLTPAQQEENPYVFGPMKIHPSADGKFKKSGELNLVFWIYGAGEASGGKPDVTIEYAFHQKLPEGEKYFNRTAPQTLNAQSLPPEFSVAAGHQLPGTLTVPLASFPPGDYRLEIKVTDKTNSKTVIQNVAFTVTA
jgi:hypothetical protein